MPEKKNRVMICLSLLLITAVILTACRREPDASSAEDASTQDELGVSPTTLEGDALAPAVTEPEEDDGVHEVITFLFTEEFDSLNPIYTDNWFSVITHQIWNAWAWVYDENNNPLPVLVTEIPSVANGGISEDGLVISMNLREDLTWSDGEPLTVDDFIFTYEMIMDAGNGVRSTYPYDLLASIEAPDKHTVVMRLQEPFAFWLSTLWQGILPAHVLRPVYEEAGTLDQAPWNLAPAVGAGPYVFEAWESGDFARFVANDHYWLGKPRVDEIIIQFFPDDESQITALEAGDGDLGIFIAYEDVVSLRDSGFQIVTVDSGYKEGWFPILVEEAHPALKDVRVRQALTMAFDRFSLNEDLLLGLTETAVTLWDSTPYVDPSLEPWPYDPVRASALLDEAGWVDSDGDGVRDKEGIPLILKHGTEVRDVRQETQAIARRQLAEVGIQLEVESYDADVLFAGYGEDGPCTNGELDICQWSDAPAYPDPDIYYWLCSEIPDDDYPGGGNWQGICDETLDTLFLAQLTEVDPERRQEIFYEISRIMVENVYWLGIWQDPDIWALSGRIQNAKLSGVTPFYNIREWDVSE